MKANWEAPPDEKKQKTTKVIRWLVRHKILPLGAMESIAMKFGSCEPRQGRFLLSTAKVISGGGIRAADNQTGILKLPNID